METITIPQAAELIKKLQPHLASIIGEMAHAQMEDYVWEHYTSYTPKLYIRTFQYAKLPKVKTTYSTAIIEANPDDIDPLPAHRPLPAYSTVDGENLSVEVLEMLEEKNRHVGRTIEWIEREASTGGELGRACVDLINGIGIEAYLG